MFPLKLVLCLHDTPFPLRPYIFICRLIDNTLLISPVHVNFPEWSDAKTEFLTNFQPYSYYMLVTQNNYACSHNTVLFSLKQIKHWA
jgi:hypothetical protein